MSFHKIETVFVKELWVDLILRIWVKMKLDTWWKKVPIKIELNCKCKMTDYKLKEINIKNCTYHQRNDLINIIDFDLRNTAVDVKLYKSTSI